MSEQGTGTPVTGAQSLIKSLECAGAENVFGIPGGAILPAYDPLFDSEKIRHILVRHEQGAGHAAEGYAMATGKVGVCIATSGPGATNLVTPIADAYMDSVPMVTKRLCLVIGIVMPRMSASWKASVPIEELATCPVTATIGTESM